MAQWESAAAPSIASGNTQRRARRLFTLTALVALSLAACAQGQGCARTLIAWGEGWSSPAASDGVVYVGTRQGEVWALDAFQGDVIWRFSPEKDERLGAVFGPPSVGNGFVYVGDRGDRSGRTAKAGKLFALSKDREDGGSIRRDRGEWVRPPTEGAIGAIVGGPALDQGLVMVGSDDGNLYAFRTTGESAGEMAWSFPTGAQIWSSPVATGDMVYFGSMDRHIYAVHTTGDRAGSIAWKYKTGGAVLSTPLLLDGMVIVGSFDRKLYALESRTGALRWSFSGDEWFWAGPATDGDVIFAPTMGGTVYALGKNGNPKWATPFKGESPIVSSPVVVEGRLVVATDGGLLHLLSTRTGEELEGAKDFDKQIKGPLSREGSLVFVGAEDSTVRAVDVVAWDVKWLVSTKN